MADSSVTAEPKVLIIRYHKAPNEAAGPDDWALWDSYNVVIKSPIAHCRYCGHDGHTRRPEPTIEYRDGLPEDWTEDGTPKREPPRWTSFWKTTIHGRESTCNFCGRYWEPCLDPASLGPVTVEFVTDEYRDDSPKHIDLTTAGGDVIRVVAGHDNGPRLFLEHAGRRVKLPYQAKDTDELTDGGTVCLRCGTKKDEAGRCDCELCQHMADEREAGIVLTAAAT